MVVGSANVKAGTMEETTGGLKGVELGHSTDETMEIEKDVVKVEAKVKELGLMLEPKKE